MAKLLGIKHPPLAMHLANQLGAAIQKKKGHPDDLMDRMELALTTLTEFKPTDPSERLLIVQMVAVHEAAMECFGRAMLKDQTFEGRDMNLKHAEKLSSIFTKQVEALDKHRGKGRQKITVEHVTVEAGGQAIVGEVHTDGKPQAEQAQGQKALADDSSGEEISRDQLKPAGARKAKPTR